MKVKRIIIIVIFCIIAVIFLVLLLNRQSRFQAKIIEYIQENNYVLDIGTLYKNKDNNLDTCTKESLTNCESKDLFFNIDSFDYYMNKNIKNDGVFYEFVPSYNYHTNIITFNYFSTYNNGVLTYFGSYDMNDQLFNCKQDYSYGVEANDDVICNYIKKETEDFYNQAQLFITDSYFLDYMKK